MKRARAEEGDLPEAAVAGEMGVEADGAAQTPQPGLDDATPRERQLLGDLVLARDALEKMKQVLSSRIRYDTSTTLSSKSDDIRRLEKENQQLRRALAVARNQHEQTQRWTARLETVLQSEGLPLEQAQRVAARAREPPALTLTVEEGEVAGERETVKGVRVRPPVVVRLGGSDARGGSFAVLARACVGRTAVEGALGGTVLVPVDAASMTATFADLVFTATSSGSGGGLPFELVFACAERGVLLEPAVQAQHPVSFVVVTRKNKST